MQRGWWTWQGHIVYNCNKDEGENGWLQMMDKLRRCPYEWLQWVRDGIFRMKGKSDADDSDAVHRTAKRRRRHYSFRTGETKQARLVRRCATALLLGVMLFSLCKLGSYAGEYLSSRQVSQELRTLYYEDLSTAAAATATEALPTDTPAPAQTASSVPEPSASPTPRTALAPLRYPDNPHSLTSSRFERLQRQNKDIIGWLNIPGLIDEAVVQRDNSYYLRRDYRGYHNDNGAIFLDENCDLRTRPYTMMVFGHNMKSGAMFGSLRNYEKATFYRNNPFITFDTAYEDGQYVIFAVGTLTQNRERMHYVDVGRLISLDIAARETAINQLRRISKIAVDIDVHAEDQLLLLITCVDDDTERRFIAARRIRPGEVENSLQKLTRQAYTR